MGRYVDRDVSLDILADISVEHRSICPLTLDRYIGRGVHKIHMIQIFSCSELHTNEAKVSIQRRIDPCLHVKLPIAAITAIVSTLKSGLSILGNSITIAGQELDITGH